MTPSQVLIPAAWAALAAFGFALLFNVPKRTLAFSALCGAIGVSTRLLLINRWPDMHIATATLLAAILVACLSEYLWRRLDTSSAVFAVPGVIPMVPGSLMFRAIVQMLQLAGQKPDVDPAQMANAIHLAFTSVLILAALAVGIAAPNLLLYRRRPEA